MTGPLLFLGALAALFASAAWQRRKRPYLFAEEFEAALNELAQHFRAVQRQIGRALIPALEKAAEAATALCRALEDS